MRDRDIPDAPYIREAETLGVGYDGGPKRAVLTCDVCGEDIYEDETYYAIDGLTICKPCMEEAERKAEL